MLTQDKPSDAELVRQIEQSTGDEPVETLLQADDRVIARVTDGIYRQPGSAIRELLSNAYDADATSVIIKTDRPRFGRISIEDNGIGMSPAALAHLILHIGGSAKRTSEGAELGITSSEDPLRSPGGRRLIGRIGIGLFSVAQLTQRFQIITKTHGDAFRTVATVVLRQYSADAVTGDEDHLYEAGKVNIWREPAEDTKTHGTTIVLTDIRPQTRDTLQSRDVWEPIDAPVLSSDEPKPPPPPRFHIGRVRSDAPDLLREGEQGFAVPWEKGDPSAEAFRKLVLAVSEELVRRPPKPQLDAFLDYYLRMVWQLGLAVPVPYIDGHPFDIPFGRAVSAYRLPKSPREAPVQVSLPQGKTLRQVLGLGHASGEGPDFEVLIDELQVLRPLRFTDFPTTHHAVKTPIIVVGQCREDFADVPRELSSGPLEFQAYLLWAPKIVPADHVGALIRIHGSSGTLFDQSFLRYPAAEVYRLAQTTCEIFVSAGLEGALNIDRESFNYAHPHVVYLTKWLHAALRRLFTLQKRIASEIRSESRQRGERTAQDRLDTVVSEAWAEETRDEGQSPPPVCFVDDPSEVGQEGAYAFSRSKVFGSDVRWTAPSLADRSLERKLSAIIQLLVAYRVFNSLSESERERLVGRLRQILEADV